VTQGRRLFGASKEKNVCTSAQGGGRWAKRQVIGLFKKKNGKIRAKARRKKRNGKMG